MANKLKYSKNRAKLISELFAEGKYTINEICSLSDISRRTFYMWMEQYAHFHSLIKKAQKVGAEKETEIVCCAAKNRLMQLIQGFDLAKTVTIKRYQEDGTEKIQTIFSTRHIPPDMKAIILVLSSKDSKNWRTKAMRLSKRRYREIFKGNQADARILSKHEKDGIMQT